jgi:hypothetical protein
MGCDYYILKKIIIAYLYENIEDNYRKFEDIHISSTPEFYDTECGISLDEQMDNHLFEETIYDNNYGWYKHNNYIPQEIYDEINNKYLNNNEYTNKIVYIKYWIGVEKR